ncbi:MAG: hypothetical protein VX278_08865 [Myxococcota bacterium]|nr:hypothetical protein [Myxococcota bacterium]
MGLSDEEKNEIRSQFLEELEKEHQKREERAIRKRETQNNNQSIQSGKRNSELTQLRSEIRRQFYEERGYRLEKDQTGRDMWLSPSEQENKQKKRARRRSSRKSQKKLLSLNQKSIVLYLFIMMAAVMLGLIITK